MRTAVRSVARPALLVLDLLALSVALGSASLDYYLSQTDYDPAHFLALRISVKNLLLVVLCLTAWSFLLWLGGLYQAYRSHTLQHLLLRIVAIVSVCTGVAFVALLFRHTDHRILVPLSIFWTAAFTLMIATRAAAYFFDTSVRPHFREKRRAIVVGTGERADRLLEDLPSDRQYCYEIVGLIDDEPPRVQSARVPFLGGLDVLRTMLMREQIDDVFITLPIRSHYEVIAQVISMCEDAGVQSQYLADLFKTSVTKRQRESGEYSARVQLELVHNDYRIWIKRVFDAIAAAILLLLFLPIVAVIALFIRMTSRGPVIFTQTRIGFNRRPFEMFKFRTMVQDAEAQLESLEHLNETGTPMFKIRQDPRITSIGRLLRRSSLDELPQLWNVLKGEMSLVGPRPLPSRDVENFSRLTLMRRFSVKPGMTGLWQVNGRSDTVADAWIKYDLEYIDRWSLMLDAQILCKTLPAVLRGSGAA